MEFTFPELGWSGKLLEVTGTSFTCDEQEMQDGQKTLAIRYKVNVIETDPSVYEWTPSTDELTVYDQPALPSQQSYVPAPPTSMTLTSGAGTALVAPDGTVTPRIEVQWDTPADVLVTQIQIQYQLAPGGVASGSWITAGYVDVSLNVGYISGVVAGQSYNVQIRSERGNGAVSQWVTLNDYTVSLTLSVVSEAAAAGTLSAVAYSNGTASIFGTPFTFSVGTASVFVKPSNYPLFDLLQGTVYWVYYTDPNFTGGAVTAIATINPADFQNKVGYYLIGEIQTPIYGGAVAVANGSWYPSAYSDLQDGATTPTYNPNAPIAMNPTVSASLTGSYWCVSTGTYSAAPCEIIYSGFPNVTPTHGTGSSGTNPTLYVSAGGAIASVVGAGGTLTVSASVNSGSTWTVIGTQTITTAVSPSVISWGVPASTNLDAVQVKINVSAVTTGTATTPSLINQLQVPLADVVISNESI